MSSSLLIVKEEGMRTRRANRMVGQKFMWPGLICHFRKDLFASVKLSVLGHLDEAPCCMP